MPKSMEEWNALLLCGATDPVAPRLEPVPVRLPLPPARHQGSIYENQRTLKHSYFGKAEAPKKVPVHARARRDGRLPVAAPAPDAGRSGVEPHPPSEGSQSAISGNKSTIVRPTTCRPMNGQTEPKISWSVTSGGATPSRWKAAGPNGGVR